MSQSSFSNRLALETSPYLLQHAKNPVDWFPWGEEAIKRAKRENKPIFLSIGYSACHWCHVMEKESFEDEATAKILNDSFVSIKVDREERPDLDNIYMNAVQIMTHRGGWPMTVFLTPDLEPFYGGTYFPPEDKMGMPSFKKILLGIANTWKNREGEVKKSAAELLTALKEINQPTTRNGVSLSFRALTEAAFHKIKSSFDPIYGGLGQAPKFFHTTDFRLALRHWKTTQEEEAITLVNTTLQLWAQGGIYDHLGGGFHRYSTDEKWLVPHFEKMLYDNALLSELYVEAYQATQYLPYATTAREIFDYVLRELSSPEGLFYSTEDADSEGVEGKFYVWTKKEIEEILSPDVAVIFNKVYSVSKDGNWEHHNILHRTQSFIELSEELGLSQTELEETLAVAKRKLLAIRKNRIRPAVDTKSLTSWNSMMIHSLGLAHQVLQESSYLEAAQKALNFLLAENWNGKELKHTYARGQAKHNAFLEDYACLTQATLTLYESTFDFKLIETAKKLAEKMVELFWDSSRRAFFFSEPNQSDLVVRPTDTYDGAVPSSTSLALTALIRLGKLTYEEKWIRLAEMALEQYEHQMRTLPQASGQMLIALELLQNRSQEWVLIPGNDEVVEEWLQAIRESYYPNKSVSVRTDLNSKSLLFEGKVPVDGKTTLYICENKTCLAPITDVMIFKKLVATHTKLSA
ncbi:MAG: thioredoxin domain-containing protein [Deltaproteobacteria bacterium]|nr:thioredoxin domain-containing protein [Deltaproteobacteria bacterium]MBM4315897.1 thioredoxin domain-containing protein [Deltaproteobacteria bacterium]